MAAASPAGPAAAPSTPELEGRLGACHALEIPFVFGTLAEPAVAGFTGSGPRAEALAEAMMDAWLAFAASGDPRHPGLPAWTPYTVPTRATQILDRSEACRVVSAPRDEERRFWDEVRA